MSANVINLRQVRKQRERAARRKQADENREEHGRTKTEREQTARDAATKARRFDGHWLDRPGLDTSDDPAKDRDQP